MPRNASGQYSPPAGTAATPGAVIASTPYNNFLADISAEMTNSLNVQGTAPMLANLNMGGFAINGLANGVNGTDAATVAQVGLAVPPAVIVACANPNAPVGWLICNGASLSTTTYANLFGQLGYSYGGSGSNFNIPDLRGNFIRGWDNGKGLDGTWGIQQTGTWFSSARPFGTNEYSVTGGHGHGIFDPGHGHSASQPAHNHNVFDSGHGHGAAAEDHTHSLPTNIIYNIAGGAFNGGTVGSVAASNTGGSSFGGGFSIPVSVSAASANIQQTAQAPSITVSGNTTGINGTALANAWQGSAPNGQIASGASLETTVVNFAFNWLIKY